MEWLPDLLGVPVPSERQAYEMLRYVTVNALPDPRVGSKEDWAIVFARMERNRERMKVAPHTAPQTEDILHYLQGLHIADHEEIVKRSV